MVITTFGIIIFHIVEWCKYILKKSYQVGGFTRNNLEVGAFEYKSRWYVTSRSILQKCF